VTGPQVPRVLVLWCPDWPITAVLAGGNYDRAAPLALIQSGKVYATSYSARIAGVTRGIRVREAQARCPQLTVLDYDQALDNRVFEPIITAIEELTPGVQLLRPGVCAVRSRGVAQYYGGELAAALALTGRMDDLGASGTRAGVADGIFTAEHAARLTGEASVRVVPAGASAEFLDQLPVGLIGDPQLTTLLKRLGIASLGQFAALAADDVRMRFGASGARLHALAAGRDSWPLAPRTPPEDIEAVVHFEPALDRVDRVAFGVRAAADGFIERLTATSLVCTAIRVELLTDSGQIGERVWLHPRSFSPGDVVDRVRWQLQGSGEIDEALTAGVIRVRILPEMVDALSHHETGLWGVSPDERIHHGLARVQSMLGHGAVLAPRITGGRTLHDRQQLVAWGDRPISVRSPVEPWPGQLPAPLPGSVFSARHPVHVSGVAGAEVFIDERGALSAPPQHFGSGAKQFAITAWAGPWPIDERWWSDDARKAWRFQIVDDTGCAWLLVLEGGSWWAEARYD
jgi:protein ImuB